MPSPDESEVGKNSGEVVEESEMVAAVAAPITASGGLERMECTSPVRILVVDDDDLICQMLKCTLSHKDFRIRTARDAKSIEAAIKQRSPYHLVILDYVIPGLTPEEAFGWLRVHQPDTTVIVITGFPTIESAQTAIRARVHDYITKPFQLSQLRQTVMRCLHERGLLRMSEQALREAVGAAVRDRRKALEMTLAELSRRTGNAVAFLSQIELGKSSPSIETLYKISLALGVSISDLFEYAQMG